ncbi:hypothetical protein [Odoribacter lunatus]|uniref:hypothetical protein n=1 Tax=Odoribacter lunatus TaxID=2941335 RepID=UPI002040AECC|nr:hypothetical protein [Odoribacter lunatus]
MSFSAVGNFLERSDYYQRVRVFWEVLVSGVRLAVLEVTVTLGVVRVPMLLRLTCCALIAVVSGRSGLAISGPGLRCAVLSIRSRREKKDSGSVQMSFSAVGDSFEQSDYY